MNHPSQSIMQRCLLLAKQSAEAGNYAIGAVVADREGQILSAQGSALLGADDPTAHPELVAIREAARKHGSRYLEGCYLYSTLEPCPMCTSAAIWAKMLGIVYGASQHDAHERFQRCAGDRLTWRQILIPCRYVVKRGTPELDLHERFCREACLKLFGTI